MNLVDLVVTVVFLVVFTAGFFAGLWRSFVSILSVYFGLVAGAVFYQPIGAALSAALPPMSDTTGDVIAFLLVVFGLGGATLYALLRSFRVASLRTRGAGTTRHGGVIAMCIVVMLAGVLAVTAVTTLVQISDWTIGELPAGASPGWIARQLATSTLASSTREVSPILYDVVAFWAPGEAPILRPIQG